MPCQWLSYKLGIILVKADNNGKEAEKKPVYRVGKSDNIVFSAKKNKLKYKL